MVLNYVMGEVIRHVTDAFYFSCCCMLWLVIRIPLFMFHCTLHSIAYVSGSSYGRVYYGLRAYILRWRSYVWDVMMKAGCRKSAQERGSMYIDILLQKIFEDEGKEFDSFKIEDYDTDLSMPGSERVLGTVQFYDGYIEGLKTVHRRYTCGMYEEHERLIVEGNLLTDYLEFHYSGTLKSFDTERTIAVKQTGYITIQLRLSFDPRTGGDGKLEMILFDDLRAEKASASGLGSLKCAETTIADHAATKFIEFLKDLIETKVAERINKILPNFRFPLDVQDIVLRTE